MRLPTVSQRVASASDGLQGGARLVDGLGERLPGLGQFTVEEDALAPHAGHYGFAVDSGVGINHTK